jgi:hypothetical protein
MTKRALRHFVQVLPIAILTIMLLPVNVPAGAIKHMIEAITLAARDVAVGFCIPFSDSDSCLLGLEPYGFAARQFAAANPLIDSTLLPALAPVDVRRVRRCNYTETEHEYR